MNFKGVAMNRREFISRAAWMGAATVAASKLSGCATINGCTEGGTMMGFAAEPLPTIKVGIVGLGARGPGAVGRLSAIPNVEVVAVCDLIPERAERQRDVLVKASKKAPKVFSGSLDVWKKMVDLPEVNLVYITTPWLWHTPMAVYAMKAGKHAVSEIPAAVTVDQCWELVETSEKTRRHYMMLENCCYGENEMLALMLCRKGMLGELVHGEGAYIHDLRAAKFNPNGYQGMWRLNYSKAHTGCPYPMHGLGPIAQYMNINRGDKFEYLTSISSAQFGLSEYAVKTFGKESEQAKASYKLGDMSTTVIKTHKGRTIMVQHDTTSPRPYSRINTISGTKGILADYPLRIAFEPKAHGWLSDAELQKVREEHKHPLWKSSGEIAKKVGGHGGMDFLMDLRLCYCLQKGLPLDMDVYDAASWSCLVELTEKSTVRRGTPMDIPDFTRGGWKTAKPLDIVDVQI